jgi:hypothetical protein
MTWTISHENILHIAAGNTLPQQGQKGFQRVNESLKMRPSLNESPLPVVSQPCTGMSYRQIGEASGVNEITVRRDLSGATFVSPDTVKGKDGKEYPATKPKVPAPISSTSANLASSNAAGGNNRLKPSLYTLPAVKTGIFEIATRYNRFLGGLTLGVGRLFPVSEALT